MWTLSLTFACMPMTHGDIRVSVETLLAILAMYACCVMSAVNTYSTRVFTRLLIQTAAKNAPAGVKVATAGCKRDSFYKYAIL